MITQRQVNRYIRVCMLADRAKAKRKQLQRELIGEFRRGAQCPRGGPYLLMIVEQHRRQIDWKGLAQTLAIRFKAQKMLRRMMADIPLKQVPTIVRRANLDWVLGREER